MMPQFLGYVCIYRLWDDLALLCRSSVERIAQHLPAVSSTNNNKDLHAYIRRSRAARASFRGGGSGHLYSAVLFDQPVQDMGVIGIFSATIATLWNFVFNVGFDRAMLRLRGSVEKTMAIRVTHTFLFEAGLVAMLIPLIAWYLGIGLWAALLMDIAIVTFYLVYGFLFNLAYDRLFPVASVAAPAQPC
jgi:uncharacterized membrane protein